MNKVNIYKIYSEDGKYIYIGRTSLTIQKRFQSHKSQYKGYKDNKASYKCYRYCSSYELFDKYGFDKCKIELIEQCDDYDKDIREGHYIDFFKNVVVNKKTEGKSLKPIKDQPIRKMLREEMVYNTLSNLF
jgi:hypothetical protein